MITFGKVTNLTRNSLKMSFFPGHFKSTKSLKNYEKNSLGIIFVISSCQICALWTETQEIWMLKVPNSRSALHCLAPPWFTQCVHLCLEFTHGLCAFSRPLLTLVLQPRWPGTSVKTAEKWPKVLWKSGKGDLVSLGRESQKSLLHRANPASHREKQPKTFAPCGRALEHSHWRYENTFCTLLKALLGNFAAFYRSLRAPKSQKKSQKGSFVVSAEKSQKIPEKVLKHRFLDVLGGIFRLFRAFFGTFLQTPQEALFGDLQVGGIATFVSAGRVLRASQLTMCGLRFARLSKSGARPLNPVLLFLGLFENAKENLKNTEDFSHLANP